MCGRRGRERCVTRRKLPRFSRKTGDKEETETLYKGEKDELTFLQPLLGLGSIMSLIRRFREPISVHLLSPRRSFALALPRRRPARHPPPLFSKLQDQSFCNPIDPTGHIRVVTVMPHRESKLSS